MRSRLADGALVAHLANPRDGLSRTPVLWSYGEAANAPPWPGKGAKRPGRRRGPNRRNASTRPTTARSLLLVQSSSRRSTARSALGGFRSPWVSSHTGEARRRCWSGRVPPVILGRARVAARSRGRAEADRVPTAGASSLPFVAHLQTNRPLPLRTRTRHLIGGGRLPVAPGIAAVDQAWDETAGAERRSHTQQHGRDCRSGPAMQHSRGRRRPDRLIGSGASRDPDGSKHKSSSLDGPARTAEFGQRESRRPRWLRVHAPTRTQVSRPLMTPVSQLATSTTGRTGLGSVQTERRRLPCSPRKGGRVVDGGSRLKSAVNPGLLVVWG